MEDQVESEIPLDVVDEIYINSSNYIPEAGHQVESEMLLDNEPLDVVDETSNNILEDQVESEMPLEPLDVVDKISNDILDQVQSEMPLKLPLDVTIVDETSNSDIVENKVESPFFATTHAVQKLFPDQENPSLMDEYVKRMCESVEDTGYAQQLLGVVIHDSRVVHERPRNKPSVVEIVQYILQWKLQSALQPTNWKSTLDQFMTEIPSKQEVTECCLMSPMNQCVVTVLDAHHQTWIECERCSSWYHCACAGLARVNSDGFLCCSNGTSKLFKESIAHAKRYNNVMDIFFRDVKTLYPGAGISDAVIDFYIGHVLVHSKNIVTLETTAYQMISQCQRKKVGVVAWQSSLKKKLSAKNIILFPCRPRGVWHWILIIAVMDELKAYILDSNSRDTIMPYSVKLIHEISEFMKYGGIVPSSKNFTPELLQVAQQKNGIDCGIHVIHNISVINSQQSIHTAELKKDVNATFWRCSLLDKLHTVQKNSSKHNLTERQKCNLAKAKNNKLITADDIGKEEGLKVICTETKGRGVIVTKFFKKDQVICEYPGELISHKEGLSREQKDQGCPFLFFFNFKGKRLCIDASRSRGIGRLINHSKLSPNLKTKAVLIDDIPRIAFITNQDIEVGTELLYDYGDKRSDVVTSNPWLKT